MSAGIEAAGAYAVPAARPAARCPEAIPVRHRPRANGGAIPVQNADELFDGWLHRLGPSATLLWWRLATTPANTEVTLRELSDWSGLNGRIVRTALDRLCRFSPVVDSERSAVVIVP